MATCLICLKFGMELFKYCIYVLWSYSNELALVWALLPLGDILPLYGC